MQITLAYTAQLGAEAGMSSETLTVAEATPLPELLERIAAEHPPKFRELLFQAEGERTLRRALVIAVDGEQLPDPNAFTVHNDHEILIMTPIAGG